MKTVIEVKSARLNALSFKLLSADLAETEAFLNEKAAKYIELALPVLVDFNAFASPQDVDAAALVAMLREKGLTVAGIRHDNRTLWLPVAEACRTAFQAEGKAQEAAVRPSEKSMAAKPTIFVSSPIRTGQQVYAENADLIVTGVVSEGAEIIADGNIHVYAAMRGRALAGADGRQDARIFIHSMQAELVSVAGIYRNFEQDLPEHLHKKAVQVYLQDGRLVVSAIQD